MKRLTFLFVAWASLMTLTVQAQWVVAYTPPSGGLENLYFVDSLHGWFVGSLTINSTYYRILYTSDGGYTFSPQTTPNIGAYNLYCVSMEDTLIGWAAGGPMGTSPGVVLKTTDGGNNWIQQSIPGPKSGWITIAKYGNSTWFAGSANNGTSGAILRTSDGGINWEITLYAAFTGFTDFVLFDDLNFVAAGPGFITRTSDGGTNWITTNVGSQIEVQALRFVNDDVGYALGTQQGQDGYLYRTTDGGFTWNEHYSWLGLGWKPGLSVIPSTDVIFVGGGLDGLGNSYGILKSSDGGYTWNLVYQEPSNGGPPLNIQTADLYHGWAVNGNVLRYDYVEPPTVQPIPNALIQLSAPFSYQVQATGMGLKYSMSGEPNGLNIGLYSGLIQGTPSQGGSFPITVTVKDTDANVVNTAFNLRVNRQPLFMPPLPPTHAWVDSTYQVTLNVEDVDDDTVSFYWLSKPNWLGFLTEGITTVVISGVPSINDTGYVNISVLADDGYGGQDTLSWILQVELYVPGNNAPYFVPPWPDTIAYVDSLYDVMLYAEDIDGDTLTFDFLQKPDWLLMLDVIQTSRLQGTPAVSDTGYHPVSVTVSDNRGGMDTLSWVIHVLYSPPPVNNLPYFSGTWPDTVVVYKDSAYTWEFIFQDIDGDTLFTIPGQIGVPGLSLLEGSGLGTLTAQVQGQPTDTGWYLATVAVQDEHGGIGQLQFTVQVDLITGIDPFDLTPTAYSLEQNYPNPFNPSTTIEYSIPRATEVRLTVYSLLGEEVVMLINEYQPVGVYKVDFNGSSLPSGVYLYQLRAGTFIETKKMVLAK